MAKRGENIYRRKDERWEGRYIKYRTKEGKIVYGSVYGKKYSEVKKKLLQVKAKHLETNKQLNVYEGTFKDWLIYWLTTDIRNQVKPTTYSSYYQLIKKHIIPCLGAYPLAKLQPNDLQKFVYILQDKGLSSGTIKNILTIVKKSLKEAQTKAYIVDNPCLYIKLPKNNKKLTKALTLDQQRQLEFIALQEVDCSPIILSLYSGMRIGEISGLKWEDIDFLNNFIYVKRTISRIINENSYVAKTKVIEGSPKSAHSIRQIPLASNLRNYLLVKKKKSQSPFVVSTSHRPLEPRTITYRFKRSCQLADIAEIRFHALRHTFATRCLEEGIDIASLSKILGHNSIKMTLDTYADSVLETRRTAMKTIDKLFYNHYNPST